MLVLIIPMGRPIRSQDDSKVPPPSRRTPRQEVSPVVTLVNPSRQPRNTSKTSREITRGPHDPSLINRTVLVNPIIEAWFECLKVGYERHEHRLNDHDAQLKEHNQRLAKQDSIMEKSNEILEMFKNAHSEHLGWARATHGIAAANYF